MSIEFCCVLNFSYKVFWWWMCLCVVRSGVLGGAGSGGSVGDGVECGVKK